MQAKVTVTTEITDARGELVTSVTTVQDALIGDNPRMVRDEIRNRELYGKATSLNLDQVEARFSRGW